MWAKIILVSNWSVFAFMRSQRNWNQSVLRCWKIKCFFLEFIKSFWKPFMSLCPDQMLGTFFVSTCLNWNCYLMNSVRWLVSDVDLKNSIKNTLYIKNIYLAQKNILLQTKISHNISQHFLILTSCSTFTELSESWIFSNFSLGQKLNEPFCKN